MADRTVSAKDGRGGVVVIFSSGVGWIQLSGPAGLEGFNLECLDFCFQTWVGIGGEALRSGIIEETNGVTIFEILRCAYVIVFPVGLE